MNLIEIDERVKNWITNNRIKWCFILAGIGLVLSLTLNFLLNVNPNRQAITTLLFTTGLPVIEMVIGGSGLPE